MSTTEIRTSDASGNAGAAGADMKLEVVVIPVSDADRAKEFYGTLGWRLDVDRTVSDDFRLIQFTPPGSACSVMFGKGVISAAPGSCQGLHLVVSDIEATRADIASRGIMISEVLHCETGFACRFRDADGLFRRVSGPDPNGVSYSSFAVFSDPDGNGWVLQEVTTRLAGRVDPASTTFASGSDLAAALRRAAAAHGQHEARTGEADPNWPDWYAAYIVAEQAGTELPS